MRGQTLGDLFAGIEARLDAIEESIDALREELEVQNELAAYGDSEYDDIEREGVDYYGSLQ